MTHLCISSKSKPFNASLKFDRCLLLLWVMISSSGCGNLLEKSAVEGSMEDNRFTNERFGWSYEIPEGWTLTSEIGQSYFENKGEEILKKEYGDRYVDTWTTILQMRKKGLGINQLMVGRNHYDYELVKATYEESKANRFYGSKHLLERNHSVEVEAERTVTTIDGVEFDTYNMRMTQEGELKGFQIMLEKKYDNDEILLISIVAQDRDALEDLRSTLMASTFSRKH